MPPAVVNELTWPKVEVRLDVVGLLVSLSAVFEAGLNVVGLLVSLSAVGATAGDFVVAAVVARGVVGGGGFAGEGTVVAGSIGITPGCSASSPA